MPAVFTVIVHPRKDLETGANGYWATCDMPNGGCTTQAVTIKDIQKNIIEAVGFYLEDYPEISDYYLKLEVRDAEYTDY